MGVEEGDLIPSAAFSDSCWFRWVPRCSFLFCVPKVSISRFTYQLLVHFCRLKASSVAIIHACGEPRESERRMYRRHDWDSDAVMANLKACGEAGITRGIDFGTGMYSGAMLLKR